MIVICTRCQAKFRVADERIGPRGAKVRCSKCQTVFAVHLDLGSLPAEASSPARPRLASSGALDVELEPRKAAPRTVPPPSVAPARTPAPLAPPLPPPLPPAPGDDPFAAAGGDPFAPASRSFAPSAPETPEARGEDFFSEADPFGRSAPAAAEAGDGDPFAAASPASLLAQAADPFSAAVTPRAPPPPAGASALPLADLGDLLGEPTPGAVRAPASPRAWAPQPGASADDDGLGLALEERLTPPPIAAGAGGGAFGEPEASPPPAGFDADPFGAAADPHAFDPAGTGGRTDELPLALATERTPGAAPEPPWTATARAASSSPRLPPAPPPPAPAAESPHADRIPGARGARARALGVNAAALAVLLLVAFALLAGWRAGGGLELASLRPTAVLDTLRGRAVETFGADQVSSGIYERALGPPLLFVRGVATSRAPAPVSALRVRVEVTRGEAVIARGEALAGAVPTAEELHGADDGASLAAVKRAAAARRPRRIGPGEAVPFLVVIADHPADLSGAVLHLSVEAAGEP